jgi:hypothetical protein
VHQGADPDSAGEQGTVVGLTGESRCKQDDFKIRMGVKLGVSR